MTKAVRTETPPAPPSAAQVRERLNSLARQHSALEDEQAQLVAKMGVDYPHEDAATTKRYAETMVMITALESRQRALEAELVTAEKRDAVEEWAARYHELVEHYGKLYEQDAAVSAAYQVLENARQRQREIKADVQNASGSEIMAARRCYDLGCDNDAMEQVRAQSKHVPGYC